MRSILLFIVLATCTLVTANGDVIKRADDVNILTLQNLVQQQSAAINSQQAAIDSLQAAVTTLQATSHSQQATVNSQQTAINSLQATVNSQQATVNSQQVKIAGLESKVQTLSKTVAFTVMFQNEDGTANGIPLGPQQTLVFDRIITNAGDGYNPTTGIFTSPLAGHYAFSIVAMLPTAETHTALALSITKNGAVVDELWVNNDPNAYDEQGSTHSVIHLAVGEQVWIRQAGTGDGVRGSLWTVFTGYLVHAD